MQQNFEVQKFASKDGEYKRRPSTFRDIIEKGGKYEPEPHRYHLFVSYACPWAHRTLITRKLKGLEKLIDVSVVHWHMGPEGWRFKKANEDVPGATEDPLYNSEFLKQLYFKAEPDYDGRYTVPVLWDKKTSKIVNNESSEIIRIFNTEFNDFLAEDKKSIDLYPEHLRQDIDEINEWVLSTINNGVYKTGFATKQEVYDNHVKILFEHLNKIEEILKKSHENARDANSGFFLLGDRLTEADIRLYVTLIRFDPVYVQHFKCNIGMIRHDFPYIHEYIRILYWKYPEFKDTTNFEHIKFHYTKSHPDINPHGITPAGPVPNILRLN